MSSEEKKTEHKIQRIGWLRAAVLGANDGILSTASLMVGVAASHAPRESIFVAGVAGLIAGGMSMAAGEYVSVSSQADTEKADLAIERQEIAEDNKGEHKELAAIYVERGLEPALAKQVAEQLMAHDALAAHARDELGITSNQKPRPVQAAMASAASFAMGASLPLIVLIVSPQPVLIPVIFASSLIFLSILGILSALAGGASVLRAALRVAFWGALAMGLTAAVGTLFKTNV